MAAVAFHLTIMLALPRYPGQEKRHRPPERLRHYLARRFARLFPVYRLHLGL